MSIREQLAQQPAAVGAIAVVILLIAGWLAFGRSQGPAVEQAWYYDLDAGELTTGAVGQVPPFTASDGHTLVRAAVFTCGDCADKASHYIAYLEQYTDAYITSMGDPDVFTPEVAEEGQLIRAADGEAWYTIISPEGSQIMTDARARCGGNPPKVCHP